MQFIGGLRRRSEAYHIQIHLLIGILCGFFIHEIYPESSLLRLLLLGLLASLLPDMDHLFYIFWYGRRSEYAKEIKKFLKATEVRNALRFMKFNHKMNTGLYSHNLVAVFVAFLLFWYLGEKHDSASLSVFFISWALHYVYDIFEDIIFFKKPNSNWFLKFNRFQQEFKEVPVKIKHSRDAR